MGGGGFLFGADRAKSPLWEGSADRAKLWEAADRAKSPLWRIGQNRLCGRAGRARFPIRHG